ncbi:MAG: hypothetical protein K2N90_10445 [Lachnospiraceae bacterium]|nr:hypothetical protein [Lachnospiraceae bacterium]
MKKIKILGLLAMSAVMLTGCIDSMPDMTTEQSDMVAEYAAGLLLKYSPNYDYRLVSDEELAAAIAQENALEEETMTEAATVQESQEDASEEKTETQPGIQEDETEQSTESEEPVMQSGLDADSDLAVELGFNEEISLRYQSFEICDSYPQNASGFSGIDAKEGRKLIVMHFDLENTSDEEVECNLYDYSLRLQVNINQNVSANVQEMPILPDDMVSFVGSIEAGKRADVVAVAEIEELSDRDIETLFLQIASANGNCTVKIR